MNQIPLEIFIRMVQEAKFITITGPTGKNWYTEVPLEMVPLREQADRFTNHVKKHGGVEIGAWEDISILCLSSDHEGFLEYLDLECNPRLHNADAGEILVTSEEGSEYLLVFYAPLHIRRWK
jgi:hypothetical protein